MQRYNCLLFVSLFTLNTIHASLDSMTIAIPKPAAEAKQGVIIMGHSHKGLAAYEQDNKQLSQLLDLINHAEVALKDAPPKQKGFFVFVEENWQPDPTRPFFDEVVLPGFLHITSQKTYKRSVIMSGDLRRISRFAFTVMEDDQFGGVISLRTKAKTIHPVLNRNIAEISFQDLLDEYESLTEQMSAYRDFWDGDSKENQSIREEFNYCLRSAAGYFYKLNEEIKKIGAQQKILAYAELLHRAKWAEYRRKIADLIADTFCFFVDAYIYHHILLLRHLAVDKILFIVGNAHELVIAGALCSSNYTIMDLFSGLRNSRKENPNDGIQIIESRDFDNLKKTFGAIVIEVFPDLIKPDDNKWCSIL